MSNAKINFDLLPASCPEMTIQIENKIWVKGM